MKKKILLITLAMVFVIGTGVLIAGNMNGKPTGNNNWGPVEKSLIVSAEDSDGKITVCWDVGDTIAPPATHPR